MLKHALGESAHRSPKHVEDHFIMGMGGGCKGGRGGLKKDSISPN